MRPGEELSQLNLDRRRPQNNKQLTDEERLVLAMSGRCC